MKMDQRKAFPKLLPSTRIVAQAQRGTAADVVRPESWMSNEQF